MRQRAALLVSVLWLAAGCADLREAFEVQYDPVGDVRPSTLVDRLQQNVADFKWTWQVQRKGGYGPVDYQISLLEKAADAMEEDLRTQGGAFRAELEKAYGAGSQIVGLLGGRTGKGVQERWRPLRETLNTLVSNYRGADAGVVYAREATPGQTLGTKPPPDDYDVSFEIEQVQKRFGTVMKSWEGAPARRSEAAWVKMLDAELAGFSTGLGALVRVKSGRKGEVVPVATGLVTRADRVGALVRDHTDQLPPQLVEQWGIAAGWLRMIKE
jgi:hypothetical protein